MSSYRLFFCLCFVFLVASCDVGTWRAPDDLAVSLPPIKKFDRIVIRLYHDHPERSTEITSKETTQELYDFLESYRDDWFVPAFGSYQHITRIDLYSDGELVDFLYVSSSYLSREVGEVHIRRINGQEYGRLYRILGGQLKTVGHP